MPFIEKAAAPSSDVGADYTATWTDELGHPWRVSVSLQVLGGISALSSVTVEAAGAGYPLTQTVLRQLPLAELEREAFAEEREHLQARQRSRAIGVHSGRRLSSDDLQEVADVYLAARNARVPVQRAVAEHFEIAVSSAAKRIQTARQRGLIPADTPPK